MYLRNSFVLVYTLLLIWLYLYLFLSFRKRGYSLDFYENKDFIISQEKDCTVFTLQNTMEPEIIDLVEYKVNHYSKRTTIDYKFILSKKMKNFKSMKILCVYFCNGVRLLKYKKLKLSKKNMENNIITYHQENKNCKITDVKVYVLKGNLILKKGIIGMKTSTWFYHKSNKIILSSFFVFF